MLSRRLLAVQEAERRRISRELHDVIAQTLTGITVHLASLQTPGTTSTKELHHKIALTRRIVEKSIDLVYRFARDLRPPVLDDIGLIPALHSHLKNFMEQTGIRVSFTAFAAVEEISSDQRTALYRVAQEALTNIARHAGADKAAVTIHLQEGVVCMDIQDNGHGFALDSLKLTTGRKRLGLLGMRERVEMVGGTLEIETAPGRSTTLHIRVPQHPSRKAATVRRKAA